MTLWKINRLECFLSNDSRKMEPMASIKFKFVCLRDLSARYVVNKCSMQWNNSAVLFSLAAESVSQAQITINLQIASAAGSSFVHTSILSMRNWPGKLALHVPFACYHAGVNNIYGLRDVTTRTFINNKHSVKASLHFKNTCLGQTSL